MTSPPALVPRAHQMFIAIEALANRTLPSAMVMLTPPGWLLLALSNSPNSKPHPPHENRQPPQG